MNIDVSVIIPTYNRKDQLDIAINSVFNQQNVIAECIVIDDGSTDGTVSFIRERFASCNLVIVEMMYRSGAQKCRNKGIEIARGEFITFLDSDDYLEPDTLAHRINVCNSKKLDALFSGFRVRFIGKTWDLVKNVSNSNRVCPKDYSEALLDFKIAPMITIMYRRARQQNLKLDQNLISGHDDDLALTLIRTTRFSFDGLFVATIVQHAGERVATPNNLIIGDAQLLRKYANDIADIHGPKYLIERYGKAIAGLWAIGQFKHGYNLCSTVDMNSPRHLALLKALIYVPKCWVILLKNRILITIAHTLLRC